jgi:hypothetical protein
MRVVLLVVFINVCLLGLRDAYADSDGYYCLGHGYFAYQFGMAPKPVAPHRLYVLSIDAARGIPEPESIELPQFQVHGLKCGEGSIDVAAFTAIYHVTLDAHRRPVRFDVRPFAEGSGIPPEFFPQHNLGMLSPAASTLKLQRVGLGLKNDGGQYLLEMTAQPIPTDRCRTVLKTRVVETDRNAREIRDRVIFEGYGTRDCGG